MEDPLIQIGPTLKFVKTFQIWRIKTIFSIVFLLFSLYFSIKSQIDGNNSQPQNNQEFVWLIVMYCFNISYLLFYIFWLTKFRKLENVIKFSKQLNESTQVLRDLNSVADLIYYYRNFSLWEVNILKIFDVLSKFRFNIYKAHYFFIIPLLMIPYLCYTYNFDFKFDIIPIAVLTITAIITDIFLLQYYLIYYCFKQVKIYFKNRRIKRYKVGLKLWPQCAICLQEYSIGEYICTIECSPEHHFHQECIRNWQKSYNTCPICRALFELID